MTLCIPLCICRLTLAWVSSEISTKLVGMPTHLDRSSLTAAGLSLIRLVSQMSRVDSHCHSVSLVANSFSKFLCPTPRLVLPWLLPVTSEICSPNSLSGFAPKQTKGSSAWRNTYIVSQILSSLQAKGSRVQKMDFNLKPNRERMVLQDPFLTLITIFMLRSTRINHCHL